MKLQLSGSNSAFLLLVLSIVSLTTFGLGFAWQVNRTFIELLLYTCQNGLESITGNSPTMILLALPALIVFMVLRAAWSAKQQIKSTQRLTHSFLPFKESPPECLKSILEKQQFSTSNLVYLNIRKPRAFCLGFLRPQIWITSGMIDLLSDIELEAVVAHEVFHHQQRDPLRLLISRTSRSFFFFLPILRSLVESIELQQEMAADQAAISHLGDDLPLLRALQKLLTQDRITPRFPTATISSFNVTEARLRRLLNVPQPSNWRRQINGWLMSLVVIAILASSLSFSTEPSNLYAEDITSCEIEPNSTFDTGISFLN